MTDHDDYTCHAFDGRVMELADWRAKHEPHLTDGKTFTTEDFPHPEGGWYWLVCPCGAKHLNASLATKGPDE